MDSNKTTIRAPAPSPTDECIRRETAEQWHAIKRIRELLTGRSSESRRRHLGWARGLEPEPMGQAPRPDEPS